MKRLLIVALLLTGVSANANNFTCEEDKVKAQETRIKIESGRIQELLDLNKKYEGFLEEDDHILTQTLAQLRYPHNTQDRIVELTNYVDEINTHKNDVSNAIKENTAQIKTLRDALDAVDSSVEAQCEMEAGIAEVQESQRQTNQIFAKIKESQAEAERISNALKIDKAQRSACRRVDESESYKILCETSINRGINIPVENIYKCSEVTSSSSGFFSCILMGDIVNPEQIQYCADETWFPNTFHECLKKFNNY